MNRRGFLQTCLALAAAPAICRADFLMPGRGIITPAREIILPDSVTVRVSCAQIERDYSGRAVASVLFNNGSGWVRNFVVGTVTQAPEMVINSDGSLDLVGATDVVRSSQAADEMFAQMYGETAFHVQGQWKLSRKVDDAVWQGSMPQGHNATEPTWRGVLK